MLKTWDRVMFSIGIILLLMALNIDDKPQAQYAGYGNDAILNAGPANPIGLTTAGMFGLGSTCKITPINVTRVIVSVTGNLTLTAAGNVITSLRFGTGTAPINGAAATGTTISSVMTFFAVSGALAQPITWTGIQSGLTPGTAIWFDVAVTPSTGTVTMPSIGCFAAGI